MNKEKLLVKFKDNLENLEFNDKEKLLERAKEKYTNIENKQLQDWNKHKAVISELVKINAPYATIIDMSGIIFNRDREKNVVYTSYIVVNRNYLSNAIKHTEDFKRRFGIFFRDEKVIIIRIQRNRRVKHEWLKLNDDKHIYGNIQYKEFFQKGIFDLIYRRKTEGFKIFIILEGIGVALLKVLFKTYGIVISSGKNSLKGNLSPTQFNLSRLLWSIFNESSYKITTQSFYMLNRYINKPMLNLTEDCLDLFIKTIMLDETKVINYIYPSVSKYNKLISEKNTLMMEKDIEKINKYIKKNPTQFREVKNRNLTNFNSVNSKRGLHTSTKNKSSIHSLTNSFKTNKKKFYSSMIEKRKIWLDYGIFVSEDLQTFKKELYYSGKLKASCYYSVLIKVRKGDVYLMVANKQEKFMFNSFKDETFEEFFNLIQDRLMMLFEQYPKELYYSCDSILLDFWSIKVDNNIKISNLDETKKALSKPEFDVVKRGFNYFGDSKIDTKGMPITVKLIDGKLDISGLQDKTDMVKFNEKFLERFKTGKREYSFNEKSEFYLIKHQNKHYIIITDKISNSVISKRCFNKFGVFLSEIKDTLKDGVIERKSGNFTTVFNSNNEILLSERKINLESIKRDYKQENETGLPNSNLGVLDLETYEEDSRSNCYSIGYFSALDQSCKTFYIERDLDSSKLIHTCINEMLRPKYKNTNFYVHNLGRFDAPFIIKALTIFNKTEKGIKNPYTFEANTRNSDILKLTIKRKIDNKVRVVKILDSYAILPRSLRDLCSDYKVEIVKSYFPYLFCTKDTLFYKGKTPEISYYNNITLEDYNDLYREIWDLKKECLIYLEKDLRSLYQVLVKVNKAIHFLFDIKMTECLTISGIAIKHFLGKCYNSKENTIPLINNKIIFDDIHSAYYGGRVEVYKPIIDTICYYYDINSLYPYASLNLMPGTNCVYIESIKQKLELDSLFGFFYCKIKSPNNYLGLLPLRTKTSLIFPIGEWKGWYFSEELKFTKVNGYEIEVIKGYNFNKVSGVFNKFVGDVYEIKSNPRNQTEKNVSKLVLNSLIGRFGMDFLKSVSKLVNKETHNHISITRALKNSLEIDDNTYLDNYKPNVDKEVCNEFGVDFIKVLNSENFDEVKSSRTYKSVSISTAAAVLSYSRIHMAKIKLYILNNGGKIYYTDTDSIVTNIKLPNEFVDNKEIGKLKLEHVIKEGYFISDKTYTFKTIDDKVIKKAKGINSSFLSYEDYIKMYNMEIIDYATRTSSHRNYSIGSVVIVDEKIKLNPTSYNKRKRVFENGKWIETKPIVISINNT